MYEFVEVYGHGTAVCLDVARPETEYGTDALVVVEDGTQDGAGRIVDCSKETIFFSIFEPPVVRTVELNQLAEEWTTLAPLTMERGAGALL